MASTAMKVLILILAIAIGGAVSYFGTSLVPGIDDQTKIIAGIVVILFTYISLFFMTKGSGGG